MSNPCRLDNTTQNKIAYAMGFEDGRADAKKEINEIMDMDVPIKILLYAIDKWLKEQN